MTLGSAASKLKAVMVQQLPLADGEQQLLEELIKQCTLEELAELGLAAPAKPLIPKGLDKLPMRQRFQAVQKLIGSLQYNHNNGYYYNVQKKRPFARIMDTARDTLRLALPIKCLEATFLGCYLTCGWEGLDRLPIGFKSVAGGEVYRHIVLAVYHQPSHKYGALGISRRAELMYKDLVYDSLADLLADYKAAYERWWHKLQRIYIGLPMEHDVHYAGPVCWRCCVVSPCKKPWPHIAEALNKFSASTSRLALKFKMLGGYAKPGGVPARAAGASGTASGGSAALQATDTVTGPAATRSASHTRNAKSVSPVQRRRPSSLSSSTAPLQGSAQAANGSGGGRTSTGPNANSAAASAAQRSVSQPRLRPPQPAGPSQHGRPGAGVLRSVVGGSSASSTSAPCSARASSSAAVDKASRRGAAGDHGGTAQAGCETDEHDDHHGSNDDDNLRAMRLKIGGAAEDSHGGGDKEEESESDEDDEDEDSYLSNDDDDDNGDGDHGGSRVYDAVLASAGVGSRSSSRQGAAQGARGGPTTATLAFAV